MFGRCCATRIICCPSERTHRRGCWMMGQGARAKVCRIRDPGPRWRQRERERMAGVLRKWLDIERQREPFEVEQLELGRQAARHAGLEFSVRIDRVDRLADGARVLIDYKTGVVAPDWRGE